MGSKLKLDDGSRAFQLEMRGLTTDLEGNEVLTGLNVSESEFYVDYSNRDWDARMHDTARNTTSAERSRWLELHQKHEAARFQVLGAEHILRTEKPTRN